MRTLVRTAPALLVAGVLLMGCKGSETPDKGPADPGAPGKQGGQATAPGTGSEVTLHVEGMT